MHTARKRVGWVREHADSGDDEVAFTEEISLMKDYIRQRAALGDKTAAEIVKGWELQFKRHCA